MLLKQALHNNGFLYVRGNSYTLYISKDTVINGSDIEKMIFECHSIGITILDARTMKHVLVSPKWEDSLNDFSRFRSKDVYISKNKCSSMEGQL